MEGHALNEISERMELNGGQIEDFFLFLGYGCYTRINDQSSRLQLSVGSEVTKESNKF